MSSIKRRSRSLVAQTEKRFGRVDGLVNNAAIFASIKPRAFEEFDSEEFDAIMRVNVRGTFECIKAVLPIMRRQGYGKIVNIASGTVFKGTPQLLPYVSSKGAVIAMTRAGGARSRAARHPRELHRARPDDERRPHRQ